MTLKIHHLNCASFCPRGKRWIESQGSLFARATLACHCLLIETNDGLILVDTGLGYRDLLHTTLPQAFAQSLIGAQITPEQTALNQIEALGFQAEAVRHIILTHLDYDHAGGLADFPKAQVHICRDELRAAQNPKHWSAQARYRTEQWAHHPDWKAHDTLDGETWFGFDRINIINNQLTDILLIPLYGHSAGHCGVAIATPQGWLLHAGDAYYHRSELYPNHYQSSPKLLNFTHRLLDADRNLRLHNLTRLQQLIKDQTDKVRVISSHDHDEWLDCSKHPIVMGKNHRPDNDLKTSLT